MKYRIVQQAPDVFSIQEKVFGFWWVSVINSYDGAIRASSLEEARSLIKDWTERENFAPKVIEP